MKHRVDSMDFPLVAPIHAPVWVRRASTTGLFCHTPELCSDFQLSFMFCVFDAASIGSSALFYFLFD